MRTIVCGVTTGGIMVRPRGVEGVGMNRSSRAVGPGVWSVLGGAVAGVLGGAGRRAAPVVGRPLHRLDLGSGVPGGRRTGGSAVARWGRLPGPCSTGVRRKDVRLGDRLQFA